MASSHLDRHVRLVAFALLISMVVSLLPAPLAQAQATGSITRYEESAASFTFSGTWSSANFSTASGGSVRQSKTVNSTASLMFTGPWVHIGLRTSTNTGIVAVAIDGVNRGSIDTYSRYESIISQIFADLGSGPHTLTLTVSGQRNTFSNDAWIMVDFVDVWDGDAVATGTFEHDSARVHRSINWTVQSRPEASGGSYLRDGSNSWFPFTGTTVSVDLLAESWAGQVRLVLDGVSQGVFDLTNPTTEVRTFSFGDLVDGAHVLQVQAYRGRATVDTFRTPGVAPFFTPPVRSGVVRSEEDDPALRYNGAPLETTSTAWTVFSSSRLSDGYGVWAKTANTTAGLTFTGPWVGLGFLTTPSAGKVAISIDGVTQGTIDT